MQPQHLNGLDAPAVPVAKIKIGTSELEPRWSFHAEYLLSLRGVTLAEVLEECSARGRRTIVLATELIAACVAHHYPAGAAPSPEGIAKELLPGQFATALDGCIAAGRAAGAIVDRPKNEQAPIQGPSETAPTA